MKDKIEITENAQNHIAKVISHDKVNYFRISVLGGGCAGFQYKFDFENNRNKDDILFQTKKISVVIDTTSLDLLKGSTIDYVNELIGSSFKVSNPQASSACGCGTSFSL